MLCYGAIEIVVFIIIIIVIVVVVIVIVIIIIINYYSPQVALTHVTACICTVESIVGVDFGGQPEHMPPTN